MILKSLFRYVLPDDSSSLGLPSRMGHHQAAATTSNPSQIADERRHMALNLMALLLLLLMPGQVLADPSVPAEQLVGFTEFQTNLPGGRHANVRTMRARVMKADGTGKREVAGALVDDPESWTQFAGWSPDGRQAVVSRAWQDPENARWEEEHKSFRMDKGKWQLDSYLLDLMTNQAVNLTAVDRVSHYNGGLFFLPEGRGLGFTALIDGLSKPYVMDLDGRYKRDVSGKGTGFIYGYTASPDGRLISYHENYQIYISRPDGSDKRHVPTGNPFNFGPLWSRDGRWVLFVSGKHGDSHPHLVRPDGTGLKKLFDRGGYKGSIEFLDVFDFHQGSSDLPVWSVDGQSVFCTGRIGKNIELFEIALDGTTTQLTKTPAGTLHYHPQPSPDGTRLLYGSQRDGVRQLFVMRLADRTETQLTDLKSGRAAMWPHWQPTRTVGP